MVSQREDVCERRQERRHHRVERQDGRADQPTHGPSTVGDESELGASPSEQQVRASGLLLSRWDGDRVERRHAAEGDDHLRPLRLDRVLQVERGEPHLHRLSRPYDPRVVSGGEHGEAGSHADRPRSPRERALAEHRLRAALRRLRLGEAELRFGRGDVPVRQEEVRRGSEERSGASLLLLRRLHSLPLGTRDLETAAGALDGTSAAGQSNGLFAGWEVHRLRVV